MSKDSGSPVDLAAAIYGCKVEELLSYHEFEDGSVAIIAPTGQKFTYPAEQLLQQLMVQAVIEITAIGREKKAPDVKLVTPTSLPEDLNDAGAGDVINTAEMEASAENPQAGDIPEAAGIVDVDLVTEAASPEAGHVTGHLASQAKHNDSADEVVIPVQRPGDPGAGDVTNASTELSTRKKRSPAAVKAGEDRPSTAKRKTTKK